MRSRDLLSLPVVAALALCWVAPPAAAQTAGQTAGQGVPAAAPAAAPKPLAETLTGEAKTAYEDGKLLFANKDYPNALVKFQRSYELSKDPRLLWNMAICHKEMRRYTRMLATLRKLLDEGGPLLTEEDRKAAADAADAVQSFVSPLRITVSEPGATVTIDDERVGTSPVAPQQVDVGRHRIRITKPGYKDFAQEVVVAGADGLDVAAKLEREVHEGRLVVIAGAEDVIALDGKVLARGRWEGTVSSGGHALRITSKGMAPYQSEVVVKDNQVRRVQVTLTPLPTGEVSQWLWIAGGAALLTGAVVGAVVLFQPSDRSLPGTAEPPGKVQLRFGGVR